MNIAVFATDLSKNCGGFSLGVRILDSSNTRPEASIVQKKVMV